MGLLQKLWELFHKPKTDLTHNWEETEQLLEDTLLTMQQELISIRSAIAGAVSSEKKTQRHYQEHQERAQSWYNRAHLALTQQYHDLANDALDRCLYYLGKAENLQKQILEQGALITRLQEEAFLAQSKISELKIKRDFYLQKDKKALTYKEMAQISDSFQKGNIAQALEEMEQKIADFEQMSSPMAQNSLDPLELQFEVMESTNRNNFKVIPSAEDFSLREMRLKTRLNQICSQLNNLN